MKPRGDLAPDVLGSKLQPSVRSAAAEEAPAQAGDDGRNIDPSLGTLSGEAGRVPAPRSAGLRGSPTGPFSRHDMSPEPGASTTYYGVPALKPPVWKVWIPTYFFVGGLAGGCLVLAASAQLVGRRRLRPLVAPARLLGAAGLLTSAALLIVDLGRPARFLNMLRVFRPTSPMNMGTWILSGAGATATASVALPWVGAPRLADAAGAASGAFGLGLASYTAVLLANTAVPAWQHGARTLPPLFVASSAASAASALDLLPSLGRPAVRALRVFGSAGRLAELLAGAAYERSLSRAGSSVVRHIRSGGAGTLFRLSEVLTAASLVGALSGKRRLSALLGLGGALALRFAVTAAGRASALDPRATFEPQRAGGQEPVGAASTAGAHRAIGRSGPATT